MRLLAIVIFAVVPLAYDVARTAAPSTQPVSTQPASLRVVSFNIYHNYRGRDKVVAEIAALKPDLLFLQEIEEPDMQPMADALKLSVAFQLHQPNANPKNPEGVAILSRFPLRDIQTITAPDGIIFAIWANIDWNGQTMAVVSLHLAPTRSLNPREIVATEYLRGQYLDALIKHWNERGKPPLIIGGDFNQLPVGANYAKMTSTWSDALAALKKTGFTCNYQGMRTRIDYFLLSPQWKATNGDIAPGDASDHQPIWIDIKPGEQ